MDTQERSLSPEMILECKAWLAALKTSSVYVMQFLEKFVDTIAAPSPDDETHSDMLKMLLLTQKCVASEVQIAGQAAESLQPQIESIALVEMLSEVRGPITCIIQSAHLIIELGKRMDCTIDQNRSLQEIEKYNENVSVLCQNPEPFIRAFKFIHPE